VPDRRGSGRSGQATARWPELTPARTGRPTVREWWRSAPQMRRMGSVRLKTVTPLARLPRMRLLMVGGLEVEPASSQVPFEIGPWRHDAWRQRLRSKQAILRRSPPPSISAVNLAEVIDRLVRVDGRLTEDVRLRLEPARPRRTRPARTHRERSARALRRIPLAGFGFRLLLTRNAQHFLARRARARE